MELIDIEESDYDFLYRLTTDKSIMRFITNGKIWSKEKIEKFIKYSIEEQEMKNSVRNQYYYLIEVEDDKIGIIGFFLEGKEYKFRIIIDPKYQGKGYFTKSLELLKDKMIRYKKIDKLHGEVHSNNYKMNNIMKSKYYYNGQSYHGKIKIEKYIIFLRPYTYLVKSDYYNQKEIDEFFKMRGNWKKYNPLEDKELDYFRLDGKHYYDRKNWYYRVILKNIVNEKKENITLKSNLSKIFSKSKFFMTTYTDIKAIERKEDKVWIVKPDKGFSGKGIIITKDLENLKLSKKFKKWSYQEYMKNPLLLEGKKFHLRVILLYRDDRKLYYFKNIPIYLAKKNFVYDNFEDEEIHISHYNEKQSPYYLDDFEMSENVITQLKTVLREVKKNLKAGCFQDSKKCYEIFGADFMLTENLELKLIEINSKIGLKEFKKDTMRFNNILFESELQKTVDYYFPPKYKILENQNFIEII